MSGYNDPPRHGEGDRALLQRVVEGRVRMTGLPPAVHTARKLRREMTFPDVMLWQELRKRPDGVKFRRQHAIGDYVLDFYGAAARLAVEIDGASHDGGGQPGHDIRRDKWLADRGIHGGRVAASRVLADAAGIADWVVSLAGDRPVEPPLHHRKADGPPPRSGQDLAGSPPCPAAADFRSHPWNT